MRKTQFANNECYHIYNRGIDKREVFLCDDDFIRFLRSLREFNRINPIGSLYDLTKRRPTSLRDVGRLVEFIAYCLNPNHYHFIIRQLVEGGISEFMKRLGDGYTKYFNYKYNRSGSLFQGRFKAVHIKSNEHLLWISAYVNVNTEIHGLVEDAEKYPWCSYPDYLSLRSGTLCSKNIILNRFRDLSEYKDFVGKSIPVIKEKKEIEKYLIE